MKLLFPLILLASMLNISAQEASQSDTIRLSKQSMANLKIKTVRAKKTTFESTIFAIGYIKPIPNKRSVISTRIAGRIVQTPPIIGDTVAEGQTLLKVESRQPGSPPPVIDITAPSSGVIFESHITLGQPVEPAEELMDIVDLSKVWAVANVPESQASKLRIGSQAHIRVASLGDTVFQGKLIRMGTEANAEAGTIEAIFLLENTDNRLRPNMRTEFSIVTSSRKDIIAIPRKAIQGDIIEPYIFIKDFDLENAFVKTPVVIGEKNDRFVEIKSGITRFDDVVTQGSYFLGFAQGGGISLKEALDAAHGHEHNEDGSDLTAAQKKAKQDEEATANGVQESNPWKSPITIFLIATNIITLILLTLISIKKSPASHA